MRMRPLSMSLPVVLALVLFMVPASRAGAIPSGPTCYDPRTTLLVPATKWLDAPGTLTGTQGNDVMVGSTGHDVISGLGGNDIICTSPDDNDVAGDNVDAGPGADSIHGVGLLKGGSGDDVVEAIGPGSTGDGGSGDDALNAYEGANGQGGSGRDNVYALNGGTVDGGSGDDLVIGDHAGKLLGGSGKDHVGSFAGAPVMDCGSAYDTYTIDSGTATVSRCENFVDPCEFPFFGLAEVAIAEVEAQC